MTADKKSATGKRSNLRPLVIRDPVHGYLEVAPWERELIDEPVSQRLRRISQTGLADSVFPEARTSRFSHSLGAMHLASRMFIGSVEHGSENDVRKLLDDLGGKVKFGREYFQDLERDCEGIGLLAGRALLPGALRSDPDARLTLIYAEAALRLAAFFHDLGHLPFSHDFEYAIREQLGEREPQDEERAALSTVFGDDAPHERIGHHLATLLLGKTVPDRGALTRIWELAAEILDETVEYSVLGGSIVSAVGWLHSLIDGDLDADRADYLLRDGRALGLDFATYDLERLLYHVALVDDGELGFVTAVREQGLSALESFVLARNRSHQAFVRHHKVAQVAAAFRHATRATLLGEGAAAFREDLRRIGRKQVEVALIERFAVYDDPWWWERLRSARRTQAHDALTEACFGLVLDRKPSLRSVWKRRGELNDSDLAELNEVFTEERFQRAKSACLPDGILLHKSKFEPYQHRETGTYEGESIVPILTKEGTPLIPASKLSPVFRGVDGMWRSDIHGFAFCLADRAVTVRNILDKTRGGLS